MKNKYTYKPHRSADYRFNLYALLTGAMLIAMLVNSCG